MILDPISGKPIKPSYENLNRDLTRAEAMLAAGDGRKIAHKSLTGIEWVRGVRNEFISVGGSYALKWDVFWSTRIGGEWENNWQLIQD